MGETTQPGDAGTSKDRPEERPPLGKIGGFLLAAIFLLLIYAFNAQAESSGAVLFALELFVALTSLAAGVLLGFLFGIPRTPRSSNAVATTENGLVYEPSNNLEQVSDWLTKILVGAGLVEIDNLRHALSELGLRVMQAVGGSATSAVTQLTVILFGIGGFLGSFLWTRVSYARIQTQSDQGIIDRLNRLQSKVDRVETATGKVLTTATAADARVDVAPAGQLESAAPSTNELPSTAADSIDPALAEKLRFFQQARADWDGNPVLDILGDGPQSADGLRLSGSVDAQFGTTAVAITLAVRAVADRALTEPVTFLLHPTFARSTQTVRPKNGVAEITVSCSGWFHAAALVGSTALVLDLRNVPGVPGWFKRK